ncbi:MAG TPA: Clp protease N-terminal domain-containing protein [Solirubrobacteraceae bacterium]
MRLLPRPRRRERTSRPRPAERFLLAGAQQSVSFGHAYVGTEHVLLALAEDPTTPAARVLAQFGLTGPVLRRDVERVIGPAVGPRPRAIDPEALATLGIDLEEVTRRVEETFGPGALERVDPVLRAPPGGRAGASRRASSARWSSPRERPAAARWAPSTCSCRWLPSRTASRRASSTTTA